MPTPVAKINLELTSPAMQDGKGALKNKTWVHDAQYLLDHNRYDEKFDPGAHDGQYGAHTAAATKRAKYLLGYPKRRVNGKFGPSLYAYLLPKGNKYAKIRPKTWVVRGKLREKLLARKAASTHRLRAAQLALTQLGINESPPYSNRVKYSDWYGLIGPWCAMFMSWLFSQVGRPLHYAAVQAIYDDARNGRNGLSLVGTPEKGDLAIVENVGHVGMFLEFDGDGYFKYVSGNTGSGSEADGGEVAVHTIPRSWVNAWVRVSG